MLIEWSAFHDLTTFILREAGRLTRSHLSEHFIVFEGMNKYFLNEEALGAGMSGDRNESDQLAETH